MMIKVIKPDFEFQDERGFLLQLVHEGFRQFNIIFSRQGVFRGGHYHQENTEAFYVISGSFELTVKTENAVEEKYIFQKGEMFLIPPYVSHSFSYLEDTLIASMYDLGVERADGTKDIYT
ncbi:MAG: cupin domain-containing protein [Lachnospiraceae bacterium]|nr:cupin domain-containing protein [Lachnospiraceae bacterium]RKI85332.1 cupin domain-containing protein [bacterium 1xD42-87]